MLEHPVYKLKLVMDIHTCPLHLLVYILFGLVLEALKRFQNNGQSHTFLITVLPEKSAKKKKKSSSRFKDNMKS